MKIIKIKYCIDCHHRLSYQKEDKLRGTYCDLKDKDIKDEWAIPKWCPLEDFIPVSTKRRSNGKTKDQ